MKQIKSKKAQRGLSLLICSWRWL